LQSRCSTNWATSPRSGVVARADVKL